LSTDCIEPVYKSRSENYASYVRQRRAARSTSEARNVVMQGTVRDKLAKFKQIETRANPAPFNKASITSSRSIRSIYNDDDEDNDQSSVEIPQTPKADRYSLQFDNDLDNLDMSSASEDETFSSKVEQKLKLKSDYESYDSDRTIELTM